MERELCCHSHDDLDLAPFWPVGSATLTSVPVIYSPEGMGRMIGFERGGHEVRQRGMPMDVRWRATKEGSSCEELVWCSSIGGVLGDRYWRLFAKSPKISHRRGPRSTTPAFTACSPIGGERMQEEHSNNNKVGERMDSH
jgi:hypothetical protein